MSNYNKFLKAGLLCALLLQMGSSCETRLDRWSPRDENQMHKYARTDDLEAIKRMVEVDGKDVNPRDASGNTPLHVAAKHGNTRVIEYLASKGADMNAQEKEGRTPLHVAAVQSYWTQDYGNVIQTLIGRGANVNAKDHEGYTPLHLAAFWMIEGNVKALLHAGAEKHARANDGKTPLEGLRGVRQTAKEPESASLKQKLDSMERLLSQ